MPALDFPNSPSDGDTFEQYIYDGTRGVWRLNPEAPNASLDSLNNVTITSPADGQALVFDSGSGEWVNEAVSSTLSALGDVLISSPSNQEVLLYQSGESKWINSPLNLDFSPRLLLETITRTDAYTLSLDDMNKVVPMNGTSLTVTVPANAAVEFPIGSVVGIYNLASTAVTVSGDVDVTIRNAGTIAQFAEASLRKRATNEWVMVGG